MQPNSRISPAWWFIPLLAMLLAGMCTFVWVAGRYIYKYTRPKPAVVVKVPAPVEVAPPAPLATEPEELPEEVLETVALEQPSAEYIPQAQEVCPATAVPVKLAKPQRKVVYTPYQQGLLQCKKNKMFPCAWEDKTAGVIKQYWLMSTDGPITRGVYDMGGQLRSETIATIGGTVTSHTEQHTTWYFQGGVLIKIRTSPYANCNLHDWFFVNEDGIQDVCQCAYAAPNCCARSPYVPGQRTYCEIFPLDTDFCH